jgi:hypothetical protein
MKSSLTTNFDIMHRTFIGYFLYTMLSADAVYLTESQYEALKKVLFFSVGRKIIQKYLVN